MAAFSGAARGEARRGEAGLLPSGPAASFPRRVLTQRSGSRPCARVLRAAGVACVGVGVA